PGTRKCLKSVHWRDQPQSEGERQWLHPNCLFIPRRMIMHENHSITYKIHVNPFSSI
ncbi:Hypothetical predicted protein, partial [Pelobates cultripes]